MQVHILARPPHTLKKDKLIEGVGGLRIMHDVGAKVHTLKDLKLHAKMIVADDKRAVVGSINLAPGSFDARRELAIETDAHHVVSRLSEVAQRDWDHSKKIDLTDEGLLADLEKRNAADEGAEMLVLKGHAQEEGQGLSRCRPVARDSRSCRRSADRSRAIMSAIAISLIVFAVVVAATAFGIFLNRVLPEHHLSKESKEIIHLGIGVIVTLTALVLGLLVASAKSSFDTKSDEIRQGSVKIIHGRSRCFANTGRRPTEARELLRRWVDEQRRRRSGRRRGGRAHGRAGQRRVDGLPRKAARARAGQRRAARLRPKITRPRRRARADALAPDRAGGELDPDAVPAGAGALARHHFRELRLVRAAQRDGLCGHRLSALSLSTAVFLILELDQPFDGAIRISDAPLHRPHAGDSPIASSELSRMPPGARTGRSGLPAHAAADVAMRILLVEDDPMIGKTLHAALQQDGYAVDWVKDGQAAGSRSTRCDDAYALVLLDLGLPKKSGLELLREVRRAGNKVRVLIVTAQRRDRRSCRRVSMPAPTTTSSSRSARTSSRRGCARSCAATSRAATTCCATATSRSIRRRAR